MAYLKFSNLWMDVLTSDAKWTRTCSVVSACVDSSVVPSQRSGCSVGTKSCDSFGDNIWTPSLWIMWKSILTSVQIVMASVAYLRYLWTVKNTWVLMWAAQILQFSVDSLRSLLLPLSKKGFLEIPCLLPLSLLFFLSFTFLCCS